MTDLFAGKPKQTAQDIAKKIARAAKDEIAEYAKSATTQVEGQENKEPSPVVEAMKQGTQNVAESVHEGIHSDENRRLNYLEKELEELRRKSKLALEQKNMFELQEGQQKPILILQEPTPKRKRGMMGPQKQAEKKQTRVETGKQVSG